MDISPKKLKKAFFSHVLALSVAAIVVFSGALVGQAAAAPRFAEKTDSLVRDIALEFSSVFVDMQSRVIWEIGAITSDMRMHSQNIPTRRLTSLTDIKYPLVDAYLAFGTHAYAGIAASLSAYQTLVEDAGAKVFDLAVLTRDTFAAAPELVNRTSLALGTTVVDLAHVAIRTDIAFAYGVATTAPETARTTVAFVGGLGSALASVAAEAPRFAAELYWRVASAPALFAPHIAQIVFNLEYSGSLHFLSLINTIGEQYLAFVQGTGQLAYDSGEGVKNGVDAAGRFVASAPYILKENYLAALESGALALRVLGDGKVSPVVHTSQKVDLLGAVLPAFSSTGRIAYEALHKLTASISGAFGALFFTPAHPLMVSGDVAAVQAAARPIALAASSSPVRAIPVQAPPTNTTMLSYPTYTTVVKGVSQDFVNQSLAALRTSILSAVAGMVQPIATQVVTNATTIQQVNMIQDLSNLTVRNGDFQGGTFDSGNITNATSITAANATFTTFTASATNLGTTTVNSGNFGIGTSTPGSLLSINGVANFTTGTTTFYGNGINIPANQCYAVNGVCISSGGGGGSGTVTSIATNNGLTGGTITTSGTIGLAAIAANSLLANSTGASAVPTALATSSLGIAISDTTGTLSVARGGTGIATAADGAIIIGGVSGGTTALVALATSTIGSVLQISNTTGRPSWVATSSLNISVSNLVGTLGVGSGGTGLTSLADGALEMGGVGGGTTAHVGLATSTGGVLSESYSTGRPSWIATSSLNIAATDLTGTLGVGHGGTGIATAADGAIIIGGVSGGTTALTALATSTIGSVLQISNTTGRPTWVATSSLNIAVGNLVGTLGVGSGGTGIATAADGALVMGGVSGGTTALAALATSTIGSVLQISNTTGRPSWVATSSLNIAVGNLVGTLGVGSGGTGIATAADGAIIIGGVSGGTTALVALATSTIGSVLQISNTTGRPSWVATSSLKIALANTTGTLGVSQGGTGIATAADGALVMGGVSGGTTALAALATSTIGSVLQIDNTTGRPTWVATSSLNIAVGNLVGTLGVGSGGTGIATAADGALVMGGVSGGTTALAALATSTIGSVLQISNTTGRPSWVATSSLNIAVGNLVGTLGVGSGGTGIATAADGAIIMGGVSGGTTALTALATSTGGVLSESYSTGRPSWIATSTLNLSFAAGGTATTTFYSGGIVFSDGTKLTQASNANNNALFWDSSNRRLGIGTSSPFAMFSINPSGISIPSFVIGSSSGPTANFVVTNGGRLGIGTTTSPATTLEVGTSTAANVTMDWYTNCGSFTSNANGLLACAASDQRLKQDIVSLDVSSGLAAIDALNPVSFYWKPDADRGSQQQYGLIAQQVQTIFPNLVTTSSATTLTPGGTLSLNYDGLISPMILAIQQLDARTSFLSNISTSTLLALSSIIDGTSSTSPTTETSSAISNFYNAITSHIKEWLASATNGLGSLFANNVHTKSLCVSDSAGGETCITKAQLDSLLAGVANSTVAPASGNTSSTPAAPAPVDATSISTEATTPSTDTAPFDSATTTDAVAPSTPADSTAPADTASADAQASTTP